MTPLRSPGSVLIVDDELKIRQLLAKALAEEGHDVVAIDSARAARQILGERIFDVLLVDNQMPEVTGLDLIRDITSTMPESERPQILMMTAHATVESALAAMKLGALDYLQKPFEIDEPVWSRKPRAPR
jgi:two-component system, NtrC family, response regulator HydG